MGPHGRPWIGFEALTRKMDAQRKLHSKLLLYLMRSALPWLPSLPVDIRVRSLRVASDRLYHCKMSLDRSSIIFHLKLSSATKHVEYDKWWSGVNEN